MENAGRNEQITFLFSHLQLKKFNGSEGLMLDTECDIFIHHLRNDALPFFRCAFNKLAFSKVRCWNPASNNKN